MRWLFAAPATLFVILAMVFPILYTVRLSFQSWSGSLTRAPRWVGLDNYRTHSSPGWACPRSPGSPRPAASCPPSCSSTSGSGPR
ncbi:hypothetical protein [Dactylosporangium cerinum]